MCICSGVLENVRWVVWMDNTTNIHVEAITSNISIPPRSFVNGWYRSRGFPQRASKNHSQGDTTQAVLVGANMR